MLWSSLRGPIHEIRDTLAARWLINEIWNTLYPRGLIYEWDSDNTSLQRNLTWYGYIKTHIQPHQNPPWKKYRFRVKSKMAAVPVLVIYVFFFINCYYLRTKHRRAFKKMTIKSFWLGTFLVVVDVNELKKNQKSFCCNCFPMFTTFVLINTLPYGLEVVSSGSRFLFGVKMHTVCLDVIMCVFS